LSEAQLQQTNPSESGFVWQRKSAITYFS